MSALLLGFAIAAMGLIIFWYVFDEAARGGQAKSGLLGMADERNEGGRRKAAAPSWRAGRKR